MESPMNTDFLRRRKEIERAASCSKMKGIYIYKGGQGNKNKYREEKNLYRLENRMQRMKRKTFTTSLTAEEMQLIRPVHQLTRHLCNCHYCQLVYEPPSTIEVQQIGRSYPLHLLHIIRGVDNLTATHRSVYWTWGRGSAFPLLCVLALGRFISVFV